MAGIYRVLTAGILLIGLHSAVAAEPQRNARANGNGVAEPDKRLEANAAAEEDKSKQEEERYRGMYPDESLIPKTFEAPDRNIPAVQKARP